MKYALLVLCLGLAACQTGEIAEKERTTQTQPPPVKGCSKEAKLCADGSTVSRNPAKDCAFDECPKPVIKDAVQCTQDVKQCPDGSYVGRNPANKCAFSECPGGEDSDSRQ